MPLSKTCSPGYYCKPPESVRYRPPAKRSILGFFLLLLFFYLKNLLASLGTFLPAALRGLETCQFLRWPNTEGLISSKCSLSLSLSPTCTVCVRAKGEKKPTQNEKESERLRACVCREGKERREKENATRRRIQGEDGCRFFPHPPLFFCIVCHNESRGLHNPAQLLSTHLITNGD